MIQRKENGEPDKPTAVFGFLIGAELEPDTVTTDAVAMALSDALRFIEGVGDVTVDVLGEVEEFEVVSDTPTFKIKES